MVPRHTTKCRRPTPHWKRMYLYFVKLLKNQNVLNTLTRNTFAHAPNQALSNSISLVLAKLSILRNVLKTIVKPILLKSLSFASCEDVALVNVLSTFPCFGNFANSKYVRFQRGVRCMPFVVCHETIVFVMQVPTNLTLARSFDDDCL